ncbi:hypothetical protein [Streptomyces sp. KN37]|uniref:hypothetical protein n=1 Tax=Streptomyces sp. KN37 TaxID=3090667 RepID=UPI002A75FA28|nr:hypothetical protein [Streptomyces sp. KN37]WPO72764.1 hypothetical protein R9806_20050 [Streptomyces sp. KN37]
MTPAVLRGPATEAVPALLLRPWREDEGDGGGEGRLLADVALKAAVPTPGTAEVGYWTAPHARSLGVASQALEILTKGAFASYGDKRAAVPGAAAPGGEPRSVPGR